ncbi:MAG: hypothetical protein EAY72_07720, partial [Bacteroidetes bacterium]
AKKHFGANPTPHHRGFGVANSEKGSEFLAGRLAMVGIAFTKTTAYHCTAYRQCGYYTIMPKLARMPNRENKRGT